MEFKFSCKWFEISFSGDPGFVETQITKYEPYIFEALKVIEKQSAERPRERPAPNPPAREDGKREQQGPEQPRGRDKHRWDRRRKDNSSWKSVSNKGSEQGDDYRGRERNREDSNGPENPPEPGDSPGEEPGDDIHGGAAENSAGNRKTGETGHEINEGVEDQTSRPGSSLNSEKITPSQSSEFVARRRTPSIRADQVEKIVDFKRPRTHHDRIMVFGYYMENEGGGSDFTIAEIKRCYRAVGQDPGINIEQVINHATRSGFIISNNNTRTIRFKLSTKGRRYVADGLKLS